MSTLHDYINDIKPTGNLSLILATLWVINNGYAKHTAATLTIGKYAESQASLWYQNDLIEGILMRSTALSKDGGMNIKYFLDGRNMHEIEDYANDDNVDRLSDEERLYRFYGNREIAIWFIDSLEAFGRLEADLLSKRNHYHRNGFFCLIYTGHEQKRMENMNTIFGRLFAMYMVNVNVFMLMGSTPYVFTYFPFGKDRCHSSKPQFHFSFRSIGTNSNFIIKKRIFPNKVHNMYGCELVVSTWTDPPYIFVEKNEQTGELISLRGIEGNLLSLLAERLNFSIKIVEPPTRDRGAVENGTATGAIKMIIDGEANITIDCYMYEKTRADVMLAAFNYMTSAILLAIPKGQPMTSYQRLIRPFKYIIWSCLSVSILLGILVIFSLKLIRNTRVIHFVFGQHNRIPFTNLWITLYGSPVYRHLPRRNFARYLLMAWLLYTFVLRSAYISELFVMLQDGRARTSLKTINEAVLENYTFFTYPPLAKILKDTAGAVNIQLIDSVDNTLPKLMNRLNSEDAKFVVPVIEHYIGNYNQQKSNYNRRLKVLSEKLIIVPVTFYMRKHSYIIHEVNNQLMDILAAGMMDRFEEFYMQSQSNPNVGKVHLPIALSLPLILGLFTVYLILLSFCFLVFLLELWSMRSPLVRQSLDFLNC